MPLNPLNWSFRSLMLFGVLACASLLGYALYVEHHMFMLPCPLCMLQRFVFVAIGAVGLLAAWHAPVSRWLRGAYGLGLALLCASGAGVAARHVWLQSLPADQLPSCGGMGLSYMVDSLGVIDALAQSMAGSSECAKIDWTWLGYSMPAWTLLCYVLLGVGALWAGLRRR